MPESRLKAVLVAFTDRQVVRIWYLLAMRLVVERQHAFQYEVSSLALFELFLCEGACGHSAMQETKARGEQT